MSSATTSNGVFAFLVMTTCSSFYTDIVISLITHSLTNLSFLNIRPSPCNAIAVNWLLRSGSRNIE